MTLPRRALLLAAASALVLVAAPTMAAPAPEYGSYGFDAAGMDRTTAPGDDFFDYANGGWLKATEIPADRSSQNIFGILGEVAAKRTQAIIETAAASQGAEGSEARKIGDYYASFMDEAAIERLSAAPVRPMLAAIAEIKTRADLATALGSTLRADVDALNATNFHTDRLFGLWVAEDLSDTTLYRPYLMQGGLWLPDRQYYLSAEPRYVEIRAKYRAHIANMLRLAGLSDTGARADRVLALETAIAGAH